MQRMLDLIIMICKAYAYFKEAYRVPNLFASDQPTIDAIELQIDNPMIKGDIELFAQALGEEEERLGERFRVLMDVLQEMGY